MTTLRRVYTTCIITWHLLVIQTMPNLRSTLLWWLPPLFYYAHEIFTPLIIPDLSWLYLASHNYNTPQHFNNLKCFDGLPRVGSMTVKEFDLLALDGHNYPTWAMDVKVSLVSRGLYRAVLPPEDGVAPLDDQHVYTTLYIIRSHIHHDLKAEYLLEENPRNLWTSLKQC